MYLLRYHDPVQDLGIHWLGVCLVLQRLLLVLRWVHLGFLLVLVQLRHHDPVQDLGIHWLGVCLLHHYPVLGRELVLLIYRQPGTRLEVDDILRQMLDQYTHCRVTLSFIILVV